MFTSHRVTKVLIAVSLSAVALAATAGPANAITSPTIAWSSPTIATGETVTLTTTNTVGLFMCQYQDDALANGSTQTLEATAEPYTYESFSGAPFTSITLAIFPADTVTCPDTKTAAALAALESDTLTIIPPTDPPTDPTTEPTPEPESLATTGENLFAPSALVAVLAVAGLGALAVRRRTAKR